MSSALRYAPHLGYAPPDKPLFLALAGSDPVEHVRLAAREGMAGVLDPWCGDRPIEQRERIRIAIHDAGLRCGCIVAVPRSQVREPLWVTGEQETKSRLIVNVTRAIATAREFGSTTIAVLIASDGESEPSAQRVRARERLLGAGDIAARNGVVLGIEPMISLPGMLFRTFAECAEFVSALNHPSVKLIFDTGHVTQMGEPVLSTYIEAFDEICTLQLADMPGRVEPGAGTIDFVPLLEHAIRRKFDGLVELEHDWAEPGEASELRGLAMLREIDQRARAAAGAGGGNSVSGAGGKAHGHR